MILDKFAGGLINYVRCLSIYKKIAIGNAIIMAIGAVGGTWLTRHLTYLAADAWLIVVFASIGTIASILINGWIIRSALNPIRVLSKRITEPEQPSMTASIFTVDGDPDLCELAQGLDRLINQLADHNIALRALSRQAIFAQEEERKRISRSLHDDTGQALSTLVIKLDQMAASLDPAEAKLHSLLEDTRELATSTLAELRKTIHGLRPTMLDDLGLIPAIRWYARSRLQESGITVHVGDEGVDLRLPTDLEINLYRIAQEAVNNILKHAHANIVKIQLRQDSHRIYLIIEDDGRGFNTNQISQQAVNLRQWGLLGIQERVDLIGGSLSIKSEAQRGTRLEISFTVYGEGYRQDDKDTHSTG